MTPGLFSDIYCASKLHLFKSIRNKWCKDWDQEHPEEAAISKGEASAAASSSAQDSSSSNTAKEAAAPSTSSSPFPNGSGGGESRSSGGRRQAPSTPTASIEALDGSGAASNSPTAVPGNLPVAATSLPAPVPIGNGTNPFPSTTDNNNVAAAGQASGTPAGMIAGIVVAACLAVLVVAGFLVHRNRRRSAQRRKFLEDADGVFQPDIAQVTRDAGLDIQDFSAAPPGLLHLPRSQGLLNEVHSGMEPVSLDTAAAAAAAATTYANKKGTSNRDSWPVQPRDSTSQRSFAHTRTPTKDVIFATPIDPTQSTDLRGLHVNDAPLSPLSPPPFVASPKALEVANGDKERTSSSASEHAVFGTPIYDDLTAAINAATAAALASSIQPVTERHVVVRTSTVGSKASSKSSSVAAARVVEDRHSMEWPDDDLEDPLAMVRLEQEMRLRGESLRGIVEEFPSVPNVDPNDPRLGQA